jgi:hypothetical protein
MKITKPQRESLQALLQAGGVVPSSQWVNGRGRFVTKRTVPAHAARISVTEVSMLRGEVRRNAERIIRDRPRVTALVAVTDLRAARRSVREEER